MYLYSVPKWQNCKTFPLALFAHLLAGHMVMLRKYTLVQHYTKKNYFLVNSKHTLFLLSSIIYSLSGCGNTSNNLLILPRAGFIIQWMHCYSMTYFLIHQLQIYACRNCISSSSSMLPLVTIMFLTRNLTHLTLHFAAPYKSAIALLYDISHHCLVPTATA